MRAPNMVKRRVKRENHPRRFAAGVLAVLTPALVIAVCFSVPAARAQMGAATAQIGTMSGRVSVERGGDLWAVSAGQTVDAGQVIVTGSDGSAKLELSDGSRLEIFPNSRVVFRANQFNLRDLLDVYLGKVRFEIQHILPGEAPLRVTSPTAVISVRGTVFEVEVDPSQETVVSVDTGVVGVRHRLIPGQEVMVAAGQSVRVIPTVPLMAAAKPLVPVRILGRVAQAVVDTLAQINAVRSSSGSHSGTAAHPTTSSTGGSTPTVSGSNTGSNQTAPPPGGDTGSSSGGSSNGSGSGTSGGSGNASSGSGSGSGPSAPPGDKLP